MTLEEQLVWLRRLLEDQGATEVEQAVASGTETDFYVSNPPIVGAVAASIDGTPQVVDVDFVALNASTVRFVQAPVAGANITIQYTRQTFTDAELTTYLAGSVPRFIDGSVGQVYQAAVFAIDSLMMGAATALDFGAGAESYSMTSVWQRLQGLRDMYLTRATSEFSYESGDDAPGSIVIADLLFDSYHSALPQYQQHLDDQDDFYP